MRDKTFKICIASVRSFYGGRGRHDLREHFKKLDQSKDNSEIKEKSNWKQEQVLERTNGSALPSDTKKNLTDVVNDLKKEKHDLKFNNEIQTIREYRVDPKTDKRIPSKSYSAQGDPTLKYVWIKGFLNKKQIDLIITRNPKNTNYRFYYEDEFYGDANKLRGERSLESLMTEIALGKEATFPKLEEIAKLFKSKEDDFTNKINSIFNNSDTKSKWVTKVVKPRPNHPATGLLIYVPENKSNDINKEDLFEILRQNDEEVLSIIKSHADSLLNKHKIDVDDLEFKTNIFKENRFKKTPGFVLSLYNNAKTVEGTTTTDIFKIIENYQKDKRSL